MSDTGFAGLMTSIALAERGHKITVLERYERLSGWGSILNLGPQVAKVLDRYGILEEFKDATGGLAQGMCSRRWQNGEVLLQLPANLTEKTYDHPRILGKRSDFQRVLYETAKNRGVSIRFSCQVIHMDTDAPSVTLANGEVISADLVIAADGEC